MLDYTELLQFARCIPYGLPAHSKHIGGKFLRHDRFISMQPVQTQKQPAGELLMDRPCRIARFKCLPHFIQRLPTIFYEACDRFILKGLITLGGLS